METSERMRSSDPNASYRDSNTPPSDDCCPICFDAFIVPAQAECGHWYCAGCILQYWEHGSELQPCKCPMCSRPIRKLTPVTSMHYQQEDGVAEVLENIWTYNNRFIGGIYGLIHAWWFHSRCSFYSNKLIYRKYLCYHLSSREYIEIW